MTDAENTGAGRTDADAAAKPARQPLGALIGDNKHLLIAHTPFAAEVGMTVKSVEAGKGTLKLAWRPDLVGNPETGVLHGGVITALMDNACGVAVMAALPRLISIATLDLRIDYLKPAVAGRDVRAFCHCYKLTRSVAFVRGVAYHDDIDDPIAHCAASFMLAANRKPPPAEAAVDAAKPGTSTP